MPQAVVAAVAEYFAVSQATAALIIATAVTVATTAYNYEQQEAAKRRAKDSYNDSLTDHQVMVRSAVAPRNTVYGRDKVSGPIVFAKSTGNKGQFLHLVVALAGHECDAIETVYFNETALPDPDADGFIRSGPFSIISSTPQFESFTGTEYDLLYPGGTVVAISYSYIVTGSGDSGADSTVTVVLDPSQYTLVGQHLTVHAPAADYAVNYNVSSSTPRVRIRKHLGGPGQVADPDLIAECGPQWTAQHVGTGVTYLYVRLEYDNDIFGQIGIPNIAAVVRGKKVRDPRTGTVAWSEDAALCAADYLLDRQLGLGSLAAEVPDAELIAAANICDEAVALASSGPTQKRYTTNGTVNCSNGRRANLETLLAPMAGTAVWVQGRWLLRAGAHRSSEFTLDETWIADGPRQITPRVARSALFNAVSGTFIDPAQGYAEVQFPPVTNAFYEGQDGGRRITSDTQMPLVKDAVRAQRLGKIKLERGRQALTMKLTCNMRAYDTLPSQVGTVNLARYGYAGKLFEVRERTFDAGASKVSLTLVETAPAVWDWNYGEATGYDLAPDTALPSPFALPSALTGLTVTTGTSQLLKMADGTVVTRGLVQWNATTDVFVAEGGQIEVGWKLDNAVVWQSAPPVPGDSVSTLIGPLDDRRVTLVRLRPVNALGRSGAWSTVPIYVVGKTQPPGNVAGLAAAAVSAGVRISWADNMEADYDSTELRIGSTWASAAHLFRGTASAFNWLSPAVGTYTILAKHWDTSENESVSAAGVVVTVSSDGSVTWQSLTGRPLDLFNMVVTPTFESGQLRTWNATDIVPVTGQAWTKALRTAHRDTIEYANPIPVNVGERLYLAADLNAQGATVPFSFGVEFHRSPDAGAFDWRPGIDLTVAAGTPGWVRCSGHLDILPGTSFVYPWLQLDGTAEQSGVGLATNLYIGRAQPGATLGADWATNVANIPYSSVYNNDDSVALGFSMEDWPVGQAYPSRWGPWSSNGPPPTRETGIVRAGRSAVRWQTNGQAAWGIVATSDFRNTPLPLGTFLQGSVDFFLVSYTSGQPGVLVRVYTRADWSVYRELFVIPPSAGPGWQRVPWSLRAQAGVERIYGIQVYLMPSPDGRAAPSTCDIVIDNFLFALFDASTDNSAIQLLPNGTATGGVSGQVTITGMGGGAVAFLNAIDTPNVVDNAFSLTAIYSDAAGVFQPGNQG